MRVVKGKDCRGVGEGRGVGGGRGVLVCCSW